MIPALSSAIGAAPRPWWDNKANCDVSMIWGGAASIGTKLYVVGGGDDVDPLTPTNYLREWSQPAGSSGAGTWASKANLPASRLWPAAASIGTKLYVSGGVDYLGSVYKELREWNQATNTWTTKANMPAKLYQHGMASIGTKLYVVGGWETSTYSAALYEWDQASNTWTTLSSLPDGGRIRASVASIGTKLFLAGGIGYSIGTVDNLYEWDQASNTWSEWSPLIEPVYDGAVAVDGTDLYVIGGSGDDSPTATRRVQRWKQDSDEWVEGFHLDTPILGAFGGCIGGRLYRYGGMDVFGGTPGPDLQELVVSH